MPNVSIASPRAPTATIAELEPTSEDHIVAGETALGEGRFADAAQSFEAGFTALNSTGRRGELGEHLVAEAVSAYEQAYQASGEVQLLRSALQLLRALADQHDGSLPSIELRAEFERLNAIVAKLQAQPAPTEVGPQPAPKDPVASVAETRDEPQPQDTRPPPTRDKLGIGLVAGGSVAVAGGLGLIIWGSQVPRLAQGALDQRGGTSADDSVFLNRANRIHISALAGGSVALGAGLGLVTWGVVRLVRKRRARKAPRTQREM